MERSFSFKQSKKVLKFHMKNQYIIPLLRLPPGVRWGKPLNKDVKEKNENQEDHEHKRSPDQKEEHSFCVVFGGGGGDDDDEALQKGNQTSPPSSSSQSIITNTMKSERNVKKRKRQEMPLTEQQKQQAIRDSFEMLERLIEMRDEGGFLHHSSRHKKTKKQIACKGSSQSFNREWQRDILAVRNQLQKIRETALTIPGCTKMHEYDPNHCCGEDCAKQGAVIRLGTIQGMFVYGCMTFGTLHLCTSDGHFHHQQHHHHHHHGTDQEGMPFFNKSEPCLFECPLVPTGEDGYSCSISGLFRTVGIVSSDAAVSNTRWEAAARYAEDSTRFLSNKKHAVSHSIQFKSLLNQQGHSQQNKSVGYSPCDPESILKIHPSSIETANHWNHKSPNDSIQNGFDHDDDDDDDDEKDSNEKGMRSPTSMSTSLYNGDDDEKTWEQTLGIKNARISTRQSKGFSKRHRKEIRESSLLLLEAEEKNKKALDKEARQQKPVFVETRSSRLVEDVKRERRAKRETFLNEKGPKRLTRKRADVYLDDLLWDIALRESLSSKGLSTATAARQIVIPPFKCHTCHGHYINMINSAWERFEADARSNQEAGNSTNKNNPINQTSLRNLALGILYVSKDGLSDEGSWLVEPDPWLAVLLPHLTEIERFSHAASAGLRRYKRKHVTKGISLFKGLVDRVRDVEGPSGVQKVLYGHLHPNNASSTSRLTREALSKHLLHHVSL